VTAPPCYYRALRLNRGDLHVEAELLGQDLKDLSDLLLKDFWEPDVAFVEVQLPPLEHVPVHLLPVAPALAARFNLNGDGLEALIVVGDQVRRLRGWAAEHSPPM